ncbi:hypothetical protein SAMN05444359_13535 [Neolewinella agarilytica]|uniref:Uncharacterized protein n=1 Tax=Neolewinella agarilytica TaxID=478744 RepID=A0A1H9NAK0_9BACT|nr:hypothetical protein SAMN05444359_13535 [Neolewinella agarilytica]
MVLGRERGCRGELMSKEDLPGFHALQRVYGLISLRRDEANRTISTHGGSMLSPFTRRSA